MFQTLSRPFQKINVFGKIFSIYVQLLAKFEWTKAEIKLFCTLPLKNP